MLRVPKADLDDTIRKIKWGEIKPIEQPATTRRMTVEHYPQGTTDTEWPQIRVEYMK
jgi:hypothetical protein